MTKRNKIIYLVSTGLLTANMLLSAGMYFFNNSLAAEMFEALSYPSYIIYPLGIAKILGIIAIWTNKSKILKEWAYAGFSFVFLLAAYSHISAGHGEFLAPVIALVLTIVSYSFYKIELTKNTVD